MVIAPPNQGDISQHLRVVDEGRSCILCVCVWTRDRKRFQQRECPFPDSLFFPPMIIIFGIGVASGVWHVPMSLHIPRSLLPRLKGCGIFSDSDLVSEAQKQRSSGRSLQKIPLDGVLCFGEGRESSRSSLGLGCVLMSSWHGTLACLWWMPRATRA